MKIRKISLSTLEKLFREVVLISFINTLLRVYKMCKKNEIKTFKKVCYLAISAERKTRQTFGLG